MDTHGGNIYRIERDYNIKKEDILDFSSNINPLGLPPELKQTLIKNIDKIKNYPDPDYADLTQNIARYNNIDPETIVPGNGAAELIYLLPRVFKPQRALIIAPCFSEYALSLKHTGTEINYFKLNEEDFKINLKKILKEISKNYDLIYICSPNNPTGTFTNINIVQELLFCAQNKNTLFIIDESFIEFIEGWRERSSMKLAPAYHNLFIIRSFTKFFAIPGLRLGYCINFNREFIRKIKSIKEPWTVNILADLSSKILLNNSVYAENSLALIKKEKQFLIGSLKKIEQLKTYDSETNFILVKILCGTKSYELKEKLLKQNILIRDASNFAYLDDSFIRLAVKDRKSNRMLIHCIKKIFTRTP